MSDPVREYMRIHRYIGSIPSRYHEVVDSEGDLGDEVIAKDDLKSRWAADRLWYHHLSREQRSTVMERSRE